MKKLLCKFRDGILFWAGILFLFWVVYAIDYTATTGEALTAQKWNDLVAKVSWVFTDGSGNVGIWNESPNAKLEVTWNIIASTPTANSHVATKLYVDTAVWAAGWGCFTITDQADCIAKTTLYWDMPMMKQINNFNKAAWFLCGPSTFQFNPITNPASGSVYNYNNSSYILCWN